MTIKKIYIEYQIPINLQEHMLRVASLGSIICDNLDEKIIKDKDLIVKTLLLHDLGNIIKFDFSNSKLLDKTDQSRVKDLKKIKRKFVRMYGNNPEITTLTIIKKVTNDKRVFKLCNDSHWKKAVRFLKGSHWNRKIACYSDMRVGTFGIIKLKDRFSDLIKRRPKEKIALKQLYLTGVKIEKQLQGVTNIDMNKIDDELINKNIDKLASINI